MMDLLKIIGMLGGVGILTVLVYLLILQYEDRQNVKKMFEKENRND